MIHVCEPLITARDIELVNDALMGLQHLCGFSDYDQFVSEHRQWVSDAIEKGSNHRENCWTESIAIGSVSFVEEIKVKLGIRAIGRRVEEQKEDQYVLREEPVAYNGVFDHQKWLLSLDNRCFWDFNSYSSIT
jgi:hypothetical protein